MEIAAKGMLRSWLEKRSSITVENIHRPSVLIDAYHSSSLSFIIVEAQISAHHLDSCWMKRSI